MPTFTTGTTSPAAGSAAVFISTGAPRRAFLREQGFFKPAEPLPEKPRRTAWERILDDETL